MLEIISSSQKIEWNNIIKSFNNWDIYYLCEYAESFQVHGDGEPLLINFNDGNDRFCYVVMKKDISDDKRFNGFLTPNTFFDFETPYGYGGPLCDCSISDSGQLKFLNELKIYTKVNGIVSQFIRFHPLLSNYNIMPKVFDIKYLHQTIYMETKSPEQIMADMDSKNRNMVRKAIKSGVVIERKTIQDYKDFLPIYEETMTRDSASDYYFFKNNYFEKLVDLKDNACFFYAMLENKPIAAAIMYYNEKYMHYHLAGSLTDSRKYSPSNLLLYEAACWASKKGIEKFHLGGGLVEDDSLFGFKKQFNKNGRLLFHVGRTIFDNEKYQKLLEIRKEIDPAFNSCNDRMIQYRT